MAGWTVMLDRDNPFSAPSDLPYGLPPFDRIRPEHLMPAVQAGIAEQRREWEAIATDPEPATVANTLEALERSGRLLGRVLTVHFTQTSSLVDDTVNDHDARIAPLLAEHSDRLHLDRRIFRRIDALMDQREALGLDPEADRLLERTHSDFVRAGAALDEQGRSRLTELNAELSNLGTRFRKLLVEGANAGAVHLTDPEELAGLSEDAKGSAATAAAARGLQGWLLTLVLPTGQPVLASLTDRSVRQRVMTASLRRGLAGQHDTREVLTRMAALRAERAGLLGFDDHASYVIADNTAGEVDAVESMLAGLVGPAVANAEAERAELEALLHADGFDGPLEPWDWAYYAEQLRRGRFGVDEAALKPYLAFDRVLRDGVLAAATALYGVRFIERDDLPTHHPDVLCFEVFEGGPDQQDAGIGLCLIDPFARDSKRGGAWMSTLSDQSRLLGERPVVTVTLNVPPPADGSPALLTVDEVETAFHEFGHAVHGLFSDVRYPRFSGTSVPRDFVEFPSQVNEMWAFHPEILARYAVHHQTEAPLPTELVERLEQSRTYGEGFATTEYLAASLLDLAWHRLEPGQVVAAEEVERFEAAALQQAGVAVDAIPPRYRSTYFSHVFAGGYSAGYYSYIWSEVLDAELVDWFTERGGLRRDSGQLFRDRLLARGGSVDPMSAFEAVRGRAPTLAPLLARRGLTTG